jgi:hypothetical protein
MIDARQSGELEFAPIRGELARAFLKHRASMGLGDASDEWILAHVDDICVALSALTEHAITTARGCESTSGGGCWLSLTR